MKNFDQIIASEPPIEGTETEDEFYEDMEAPKFVDLTIPDHYHPDDRYWFCSRVGCDQKHEEELNWEEINKNFVLRVMAARSPNIKIRKMLTKKSPTLKCPQTVPTKLAKSRISRLAVASSISRKLIYVKDNTKPLSKLTTTLKANSKKPDAVASKAFTTPRNNRKRISNHTDGFRSVRNPKPKPSIAVAKTNNSKFTEKGLVFASPKKVKVKVKTSAELTTPVRKLCAAMKKLEIATGKKRLLETKTPVGKLCAAMSKLELASAKKNPTFLSPLDRTARKQFRGREVKSRVFDSLKKVERKKREIRDLDQSSDPKEIDKKLKLKIEIPTLSSEPKDFDEKSKLNIKIPTLLSSKEDSEENLESSAVKIIGLRDTDGDDKENNLPSIIVAEDEIEIENARDEKENTTVFDTNREPSGISGEKIPSSRDLKKVNQVTKKPLKKSSIQAATFGGAQEAKYRKPKPTNPKPFRLRTDERGILKEATLEKKLVTPLREITTLVKPKSSRKTPTPSQQENVDENVRQQTGTRMEKIDIKPEKTTSSTRTKTTTAPKIPYKSSERTTRFPKSLEKSQGTGWTGKTARLGILKERSPSESGPRSVSRGRTTIPREPNFHTIHVPKSCTKRVP